MKNQPNNMLLLLKFGIPFMIALLLSIVITIINYGFTGPFFYNWGKGLVVAMIVIPIGLRLIPYVAGGVRAVLGDRPAILLRCVVAVCVAVMMETIVSLAVTLAQRGLVPGWQALWGLAFLKALPVGLLIGFSMTFIVHPWMQRIAASGHGSPGRQ